MDAAKPYTELTLDEWRCFAPEVTWAHHEALRTRAERFRALLKEARVYAGHSLGCPTSESGFTIELSDLLLRIDAALGEE